MEPLYATVIACWLGLGCMLAESDRATFTPDTMAACEVEVERMVPIMESYVDLRWGYPSEVIGKCVTQTELNETLGR